MTTGRNSNVVRYIRAIESEGSISAASSLLGISQPALSGFLKKIESQIGAVVFDRLTAPLKLTEAGKAYLEFEESILGLERDFVRRLSDIEGLRSGELVIGGTASFSMTLLPRVVAEFARKYPGIDVSIVADTLPNLALAATNGLIDVFIASSLQDNGAFDCIAFAQEPFFLCVPGNWSLCEQLPLPGEEGFACIGAHEFELLRDCRFITMQDDQQMGRELEEILEFYGIVPKQIIQVNQALTALALVREGVGISLITEGALNCYKFGVEPLLYVPDARACVRDLYIAQPNNHSTSLAAQEFIKLLVNP